MAVLASDDFNRANSGSLGSNWTDRGFGFDIVSNVASVVASGDDLESYWTGALVGGGSWPNDQYSQAAVTIASTGGGGQGVGMATRFTTAGTRQMYRLVCDKAASNNIELSSFVSGSYALVGQRTSTITNGDVLRLESQGTTQRIFKNGTQVGASITNSAVASGSAGLSHSSSTTSASVDNWSGGDFAAGATSDVAGSQPASTGALTYTVPQVARPASDVSIGTWTNDAGGTTNLYQSIDEGTFSDADYIQSAVNPTTDLVKIRLGALVDPAVNTGHIARYRYMTDVVAGQQIDLVVRLYQADGTTVVASQSHTNIGAVTAGNFTLSGAEADSIPSADYATGLVLGFEATAP